MMEQAAHHLDLFFRHPLDPPDVVEARKVEMATIEGWVDRAYRAYGGVDGGVDGSGSSSSSSDGSSLADGDSSNSGGGGCVGDGCGPNAYHTGENSRKPARQRSWLDHVPPLTADW